MKRSEVADIEEEMLAATRQHVLKYCALGDTTLQALHNFKAPGSFAKAFEERVRRDERGSQFEAIPAIFSLPLKTLADDMDRRLQETIGWAQSCHAKRLESA